MFKWPEFPNGQKQGQKNIEPYHVLSEVDQMLIRHFQGPWNDFIQGVRIDYQYFEMGMYLSIWERWEPSEVQMFNLSIAKFSPKQIFNILTWQQSRQSLGTYLFENLEMAAR